jgi:hypothetical protein
MEKRSTHWADVLNWLQTVTDSCKTHEQAQSCELLIRNFHRTYQEKLGLREVWELTKDMERKLWKIGELSLKQKLDLI